MTNAQNDARKVPTDKGNAVKDNDTMKSWDKILQRLKIELGENVFNSWFGRLELDREFGSVAICSVPTKFLKSWIESHFLDTLEKCVRSEFPDVLKVVLNVRSPVRIVKSAGDNTLLNREAILTMDQSDRTQDPSRAFEKHNIAAQPLQSNDTKSAALSSDSNVLMCGSPLDRRLTFDTFLVGSSNQLAHAAAQQATIAPNSGGLPYNPLYIHSSVGLGKTHLLQAIAHKCTEHNKTVIYLTAEKFMYSFVSALKLQTAIAYKEWLRTIDLLVIDDLQFLQGKILQHEFGHTLNSLIDAGRQIIIAADKPPAEQEGIDERIRSRLSGGLCLEIKPFDEDLRRRVVQSRVAAAQAVHQNLDIPPAIVNYIAGAIKTNGRDLEGAVNRLIAHATLSNAKLTIQSVETAIQDLVRTREPRRVKVEDILKLVATHYNVSKQDILSSRRTAIVVKPRQVAMYLAKTLTLRSLPEIGRRFGGRDHTTVLHAVRKIEALSAKDSILREELELLKRMLSE